MSEQRERAGRGSRRRPFEVTAGDGAERSRGERGAALLLVLIFGVGGITLALLLLTLSEQAVRDQAEQQRRETLQGVLRAGIAAAIHEINVDRFQGPYDPGQDGVGALLREDPSAGGFEGIPVFATQGLLGRYRTTVAPDPDAPDTYLVTAVAVVPDFTRPRLIASAQVRVDTILPQWLSDKQPLSIVGPASAGGAPRIDVRRGAQIDVTDPSLTVPAANVSDPAYHELFVGAVTGPGSNTYTFLGSDPQSPGNVAEGADTITNTSPGIVSPELAAEVAAGVQTHAAERIAAGASLQDALAAQGAALTGDRVPSGSWTLPEGTYYTTADRLRLDSGTNLQGSGTLIVAGDFETGSGRLDWQGDVIVVDLDPSDARGAELRVGSGGRLSVEGTLAVQGNGGAAGYQADSGSRIHVDGLFLVLSDGGTKEYNDHGSRTVVDGIMLHLGDGIGFETGSGGGLEVNGSLVLAVPEGAERGIETFRLAQGSHSTVTWSDVDFDQGLAVMRGFSRSLGLDQTVFPAGALVYVEGVGPTLLAAQQALLESADVSGGGVGYPPH